MAPLHPESLYVSRQTFIALISTKASQTTVWLVTQENEFVSASSMLHRGIERKKMNPLLLGSSLFIREGGYKIRTYNTISGLEISTGCYGSTWETTWVRVSFGKCWEGS